MEGNDYTRKKKGKSMKGGKTSTTSTKSATIADMVATQLDLQKKLATANKNLETAMADKGGHSGQARAPVSELLSMYGTDTEPHTPTESSEDYPAAAQQITTKTKKKKKTLPAPEVPSTSRERRSATAQHIDEEDTTTTSDSEDTSTDDSTVQRKKARKAVRRILKAAAPALTNKRGKKKCLPFNCIKRGSKFCKLGPGEASLPEYFLALRTIVKLQLCPKAWVSHIKKHEEHILTMAKKWDWPTCRQWSETVFIMLNDGSLVDGWTDMEPIRDIQREITESGGRAGFTREEVLSKTDKYKKAANKASSYTSTGSYASVEKQTYVKEKDGKPCFHWNWGRECGFSASHGENEEARPHICAFCAYKSKRVLFHREKDCINKIRSANYKSTSQQGGKDFR